MPKRPPKKWFDRCTKGVKSSRSGINPGAICGNIWYNRLSNRQKSEIMKSEKGMKRG